METLSSSPAGKPFDHFPVGSMPILTSYLSLTDQFALAGTSHRFYRKVLATIFASRREALIDTATVFLDKNPTFPGSLSIVIKKLSNLANRSFNEMDRKLTRIQGHLLEGVVSCDLSTIASGSLFGVSYDFFAVGVVYRAALRGDVVAPSAMANFTKACLRLGEPMRVIEVIKMGFILEGSNLTNFADYNLARGKFEPIKELYKTLPKPKVGDERYVFMAKSLSLFIARDRLPECREFLKLEKNSQWRRLLYKDLCKKLREHGKFRECREHIKYCSKDDQMEQYLSLAIDAFNYKNYTEAHDAFNQLTHLNYIKPFFWHVYNCMGKKCNDRDVLDLLVKKTNSKTLYILADKYFPFFVRKECLYFVLKMLKNYPKLRGRWCFESLGVYKETSFQMLELLTDLNKLELTPQWFNKYATPANIIAIVKYFAKESKLPNAIRFLRHFGHKDKTFESWKIIVDEVFKILPAKSAINLVVTFEDREVMSHCMCDLAERISQMEEIDPTLKERMIHLRRLVLPKYQELYSFHLDAIKRHP
ncbi:MAG: hypothetical protein MRY21_04555 [Simkaniaceae bacterium]|nr:hypothetical protein [Simkaniaceae bacterium]